LGRRVSADDDVVEVLDHPLFVADDAPTAAEVALQLSERIPQLANVPDLRVGLACGTVMSRLARGR